MNLGVHIRVFIPAKSAVVILLVRAFNRTGTEQLHMTVEAPPYQAVAEPARGYVRVLVTADETLAVLAVLQLHVIPAGTSPPVGQTHAGSSGTYRMRSSTARGIPGT